MRTLSRFDNTAFKAVQPEAFASSLMEYVRDSASSSRISEEAIEELEALVERKVAELPPSRISAEALIGIISIVVMVMLFLANIAYLEMKESEQPKNEPLSPTQIERIIESVEKSKTLIPPNDKSTYYIVERQVPIRVKPNNRSATVALLYPNQKVRLEKSAHQWIYVEYFDFIEGLPRLGWVDKKYLKKLE